MRGVLLLGALLIVAGVVGMAYAVLRVTDSLDDVASYGEEEE